MRCRKEVRADTQFLRYRRCRREAVLDGYCKQHHPHTETARFKASMVKNAEYAKRLRLNNKALVIGWIVLDALLKRSVELDDKEPAELLIKYNTQIFRA